MFAQLSLRFLTLFIILVSISGFGCSKGKKSVVAVQGTVVTAGNQPAVGALLVFHNVSGEPESAHETPPTATVKEDGTFRPTTYSLEDGLPEGDYKVTVTWNEKSQSAGSMIGGGEERGFPKSLILPKYSDPKQTPLTAKVTKGQTEAIRLQVE